MGFFNILETFFFISLAITFVLIMMLVYHFKGRIAILEQKCDTMFDIMNNMVKEMRMIKMQTRMNNETIIFNDRMPVNRFSQFEEVDEEVEEDDDEEDDDEEDDDEEEVDVVISNKIIVSDDEDDDDVKIITIDLDDNEIECEAEVDNEVELDNDTEVEVDVEVETLDNLEEIQDIQDIQDIQEIQEVYESDEQIISVNKLETETIEVDESLVKPEPIDYKKLDITYLRTMVITRGLSTDTKKLKKNDLVKLLEQNE